MGKDYEITGEAGKINSPYTQADKTGLTLKRPDGSTVTVFSDTVGADSTTGTSKDDIFLVSKTGTNAQGKPGMDSIQAGAGKDLVILPGKQSDWTPKLPNAGDYPGNLAKEFWEKSPQAYGRVLVMEHRDGSKVNLRDVETVAFSDGKAPFNKPLPEGAYQRPFLPPDVAKFEEDLKSGQIKTQSTSALLKKAEEIEGPDKTNSAKFQSTKEASDLLAKIPPMNRPDIAATGTRIGQDLAQDSTFADQVKKAPITPTLQ